MCGVDNRGAGVRVRKGEVWRSRGHASTNPIGGGPTSRGPGLTPMGAGPSWRTSAGASSLDSPEGRACASRLPTVVTVRDCQRMQLRMQSATTGEMCHSARVLPVSALAPRRACSQPLLAARRLWPQGPLASSQWGWEYLVGSVPLKPLIPAGGTDCSGREAPVEVAD